MIDILKKYGNHLAWGTLGLLTVITVSQLAVQRYSPGLWCAPMKPGGRHLVCGIGNASPWYLAYLGLLILISGVFFLGSSLATFQGGVKRHGWLAYTLSAIVVFGTIVIVVALSGELNDQ